MTAIVALILAALALLHVYWGTVGVSGRSIALPEVDGKPTFRPSRLSCFAVASALAVAALLVAWRGGLVPSPLPGMVATLGTAGVGAVFVLRAIGDFRLVGFFKRVRGTPFAKWDSRRAPLPGLGAVESLDRVLVARTGQPQGSPLQGGLWPKPLPR